jgi:hypothetical protein
MRNSRGRACVLYPCINMALGSEPHTVLNCRTPHQGPGKKISQSGSRRLHRKRHRNSPDPAILSRSSRKDRTDTDSDLIASHTQRPNSLLQGPDQPTQRTGSVPANPRTPSRNIRCLRRRSVPANPKTSRSSRNVMHRHTGGRMHANRGGTERRN